MIRRDSLTSITYIEQQGPSVVRKNDKQLSNLLHIKCPAVCLIKHQIQTLNSKVIDELEEIKK